MFEALVKNRKWHSPSTSEDPSEPFGNSSTANKASSTPLNQANHCQADFWKYSFEHGIWDLRHLGGRLYISTLFIVDLWKGKEGRSGLMSRRYDILHDLDLLGLLNTKSSIKSSSLSVKDCLVQRAQRCSFASRFSMPDSSRRYSCSSFGAFLVR